MKNLFLTLTIFLPFLLFAQVNEHSEAFIFLNEISAEQPKLFSISETPNFVFNGNGKRNHLATLSLAQENILVNNYEYPLYVSYGYAYLERDIYNYQNALKKWNETNLYRSEEINLSVGWNK